MNAPRDANLSAGLPGAPDGGATLESVRTAASLPELSASITGEVRGVPMSLPAEYWPGQPPVSYCNLFAGAASKNGNHDNVDSDITSA